MISIIISLKTAIMLCNFYCFHINIDILYVLRSNRNNSPTQRKLKSYLYSEDKLLFKSLKCTFSNPMGKSDKPWRNNNKNNRHNSEVCLRDKFGSEPCCGNPPIIFLSTKLKQSFISHKGAYIKTHLRWEVKRCTYNASSLQIVCASFEVTFDICMEFTHKYI